MPEYQFYYTTRGENAEACKEAYEHWRTIVKRSENKIWATDYNTAPPMSGITLTLTEDKLPMLEQLRSGIKWYGDDAVKQMARLAGGTQVNQQRYVMYTSKDISYQPVGLAVMVQDYHEIMAEYESLERKWHKEEKKARAQNKVYKASKPVRPVYLIKGKDRLPILVSREAQPTVWYGMAAVDWARMVESLN